MTGATKWLAAGLLAVTGVGLAGGPAAAGDGPRAAYPPGSGWPGPYNPGPFPPRPYPPGGPRYDADYVVYVRHHHHWDRHGRYETRYQAERAAWHLERHGYQVRIERVYGGRPHHPW